MLTILLHFFLSMAMTLGVDIDQLDLPPEICGEIETMSGSSSKSGCSKTTKSAGYNPNQPLRIYNGF